MKSVLSKDLPAHRAFYTEFDLHGNSFENYSNSELVAIRVSIERKLKLLLLTKANVLIAASQLLESPFAHELILKHPRLVESGAVVSSMKLTHFSTVDFLDSKREEKYTGSNSSYFSSEALEVASLIDDKGVSIRWPLEAMSDWFRDRLAQDLSDEKSLIRAILMREGVLFPESLADSISKEDALSRGRVDEIVAETGDSALRDFLNLYADFVYYLSGARATESEGVLPQENLVDISLSDLAGARTALSENEIFFKVFIDTVKARTSTVFPNDFLDAISIEDALDLRCVAASSEFVSEYNDLQLKTKQSIAMKDPDGLVLLLCELEEFETGLYSRFSEALNNELSSRLVEERQRAGGQVLHSIASIAVPGYGVGSYKDLFVSGLRWTGKREAADVVERKVAMGLNACERTLERMGLLQRQALLDYLDQLKNKYSDRMFGK